MRSTSSNVAEQQKMRLKIFNLPELDWQGQEQAPRA